MKVPENYSPKAELKIIKYYFEWNGILFMSWLVRFTENIQNKNTQESFLCNGIMSNHI